MIDCFTAHGATCWGSRLGWGTDQSGQVIVCSTSLMASKHETSARCCASKSMKQSRHPPDGARVGTWNSLVRWWFLLQSTSPYLFLALPLLPSPCPLWLVPWPTLDQPSTTVHQYCSTRTTHSRPSSNVSGTAQDLLKTSWRPHHQTCIICLWVSPQQQHKMQYGWGIGFSRRPNIWLNCGK